MESGSRRESLVGKGCSGGEEGGLPNKLGRSTPPSPDKTMGSETPFRSPIHQVKPSRSFLVLRFSWKELLRAPERPCCWEVLLKFDHYSPLESASGTSQGEPCIR